MSAYPAEREADVALRDGSTVHVRPVRRDDEEALLGFFEALDPTSRMFRFFSGAPDVRAAVRVMLDVDYAGRYGLVALRGEGGEVIGQGMYVEGPEGRAEIAFAVSDHVQGLGLGTLLLAHLAEVAQEKGISVFVAEVLPQNHRMIEVFRESGFPVEMSSRPGAIQVELPTSFSEQAIGSFEERDRLAAEAAVRPFLEPNAVAVIGASRRLGTVGGQLFHNALESGFEGVVYPVNPTTEVVQSVRAYPSIADVPDRVDLAVVVVPAPPWSRSHASARPWASRLCW